MESSWADVCSHLVRFFPSLFRPALSSVLCRPTRSAPSWPLVNITPSLAPFNVPSMCNLPSGTAKDVTAWTWSPQPKRTVFLFLKQNEHHHQPSRTHTTITTGVTIYSVFLGFFSFAGRFPCVNLCGLLVLCVRVCLRVCVKQINQKVYKQKEKNKERLFVVQLYIHSLLLRLRFIVYVRKPNMQWKRIEHRINLINICLYSLYSPDVHYLLGLKIHQDSVQTQQSFLRIEVWSKRERQGVTWLNTSLSYC